MVPLMFLPYKNGFDDQIITCWNFLLRQEVLFGRRAYDKEITCIHR